MSDEEIELKEPIPKTRISCDLGILPVQVLNDLVRFSEESNPLLLLDVGKNTALDSDLLWTPIDTHRDSLDTVFEHLTNTFDRFYQLVGYDPNHPLAFDWSKIGVNPEDVKQCIFNHEKSFLNTGDEIEALATAMADPLVFQSDHSWPYTTFLSKCATPESFKEAVAKENNPIILSVFNHENEERIKNDQIIEFKNPKLSLSIEIPGNKRIGIQDMLLTLEITVPYNADQLSSQQKLQLYLNQNYLLQSVLNILFQMQNELRKKTIGNAKKNSTEQHLTSLYNEYSEKILQLFKNVVPKSQIEMKILESNLSPIKLANYLYNS